MVGRANKSNGKRTLLGAGASAEAQIFGILRDEILSGRWEVGSAIPSLRELSKRFGVSRVPVHRAIIKLEEGRLVKRVHGSGVHVLRNTPQKGERKLPLVQTFDVLRKPETALRTGPGEATHFVSAAEQSMLWHLAKTRAVRLRRIPVVDNSDMKAVLEELPRAEVDVFVFATPESMPVALLNLLRDFVGKGGAVVYRATWMDIAEFDAVKLDFEDGQYQLTAQLFEMGVERLIRCHLPVEAVFETQKQAGFQRACREHGWEGRRIAACELAAPASGADRAEELQNAIRWLKSEALPLDPQAIMAVNDPEAAVLRLALDEIGHTDIQVTGYDAVWNEIDWAKFLVGLPTDLVERVQAMPPPISVDAGHWEMGEALARLALERAAKKLPPGRQVRILPQKLVLPEGQTQLPS